MIVTDADRFAFWLRKTRRLQDRSVVGLAMEARVSQMAIAKWERAETQPTLAKLVAVCQVLGYEVRIEPREVGSHG